MSDSRRSAAGSPLGVCLLPPPPPNAPRTVRYPQYLFEILDHAGLCYDPVAFEELPKRLDGLRILVTAGEHPLPSDLKDRLARWVEAGGAWLSIGGLCGMEALLGAGYRPSSFVLWGGTLRVLGEGYLDARGSGHPVLRGLPLPLHFFNGIAVEARGAEVLASALDAHHRPADQPVVLERAAGKGRCLLLAPDVTGTVVHIQQGIPVLRDGTPAADGTGPVTDGVLKSDDGQVLDWLLDREPLPGVPELSAFLQPVADQWRGLVLRAIFHLAAAQGVPLPLLWYWPRGLPAVGHLSHDTDGNDPALARALLDTLDRARALGTWCVILPGYDGALIAEIRERGHELATHFDAMTPGHPWDEEHFDRQWRELSTLFGEPPVTNKNHYLRWEGDTELWEWCAARGIRLDQSKGASKTGEAGFNFGTCHPYRTLIADGRTLPVFELPTPTQDLLVFAPEALAGALLDAVLRQHGVLHLLFHPAHIGKPGVADALVRAVQRGRERGLEWWTARRIAEWEEARRSVVWSDYRSAGGVVSLRLRAGAPLGGATLLWLGEGGAARVNGRESRSEAVERWGFPFRSVTFDLLADHSVTVEMVR